VEVTTKKVWRNGLGAAFHQIFLEKIFNTTDFLHQDRQGRQASSSAVFISLLLRENGKAIFFVGWRMKSDRLLGW
jgi:hypothetical protein